MAVAATSRPRVTLDGKFFRLGEKKFYVKGVSYGPFAPTKEGGFFPPPVQARRDLETDPGTGRKRSPGLLRASAMVAGSRP